VDCTALQFSAGPSNFLKFLKLWVLLRPWVVSWSSTIAELPFRFAVPVQKNPGMSTDKWTFSGQSLYHFILFIMNQ
jgi:hypothetical protein